MAQHGGSSAAHIALGVDRGTSLREAVAKSTLAASLLDAETYEVIVSSPVAAKLMHTTQDKLVGKEPLDFLLDGDVVNNAMGTLASGALESYQALRTVQRSDGSKFRARLWVRSSMDEGRQVLLVVFTEESAGQSAAESLGFVGPPPELPAVPGLDLLSGRETEVLERLISGARVPQIAEQMFLAPATVRNHLSSVYRKLGVHTQGELVALLRPPAPDPPPDSR